MCRAINYVVSVHEICDVVAIAECLSRVGVVLTIVVLIRISFIPVVVVIAR